MSIKRLHNYKIKLHQLVDYTEMGNVTRIRYMLHRNNSCNIKRLNADNYIYLPTGEVKEFQHISDRSQCLKSVERSLRCLRELLNTNVVDVKKCRWITLTYAENMTDSKRLYSDYVLFWKRFKYWCNKNGYGKPEYIIACEPQSRGAWHIHAVFIFEQKAPYIENSVLRTLWGQGFVKIKKLDDVDNVGAYLTAYLGDMSLDEYKEDKPKSIWVGDVKEIEVEQNGEKIKKKYLKGARLFMYPPKFNLFRYSRGICKPVTEVMTYKKAKEKASAATLTFSNAVQFSSGEFENTIATEFYNSARKH